MAPAWSLEEKKAVGVAAGLQGELGPSWGICYLSGCGPPLCTPGSSCSPPRALQWARGSGCPPGSLHGLRCLPGLIDVLGREILKDGGGIFYGEGSKPPGRPAPPSRMALGFVPTECNPRPGLSSCRRRQVSRRGNIGGRRRCPDSQLPVLRGRSVSSRSSSKTCGTLRWRVDGGDLPQHPLECQR